jgi:hypothetical protein
MEPGEQGAVFHVCSDRLWILFYMSVFVFSLSLSLFLRYLFRML